MACHASRSRFVLALALFFGASSPAFAFPILTTTAAMYLTPLLVAFMSGSIALYSKRARKTALTVVCLAIGFLLFNASINTKMNNAPQKQKYDYNFERSDMNMSVFMPRAGLTQVIASTDDYLHIKVQDVREVLFDVEDTFGFSEHEKAIDAINSSGKSMVFISSFRDGATLTFAEKISSKVKAKLYLVKSGSPIDFCAVTDCDKKLNVIPFDASDINLYSRFAERGSHMLKDFNIITSRSENTYTEMYRKGMLYIDSDLVLSRSDEYWEKLRSKLNPHKKVLLGMTLSLDSEPNLTKEQRTKIEDSYIRYIANKLKLDTLYYTPSIESVRMISFKAGDTIVTPYFKGDTSFVSPLKALVKRKKSDDYYKTLCFSDECVDTFGRNVAYNIANSSAVTFDGEVNVDIKAIKNLKGIGEGRILVNAHDTHSSMLARLVAHELVINGMDFAGFTEHYSRYYGNSRTFYFYGDYQFVYDDLWLDPLLDVMSAIDIDALDTEIELNVYLLTLVCVLFGLMSGIKGYSTPTSLLFVVLCLGLLRFTYLPSHFMEKELIIAPITAILLGVFFWLKLKSIKIALLGSLIILVPFYFSATDTLSNHAIAFYLIGGILSCLLFKANKTVAMNGDKYAMTVKYLPRLRRGQLVSNLGDAKRLIKRGKYLLRSNHLSSKEHGLSGYFDSYLVTTETINETWENAVHELQTEGLSPSEIQFWLMPALSFSQKGVMSSLGQNPALIGVSMGEGDDVTEGVSSSYRELSRSRAEQERFPAQFKMSRVERKLVELIKRIEEREGMPVVVEFGINRFHQITVLQVRHQETELLTSVVESILLDRYQVVSLDNFTTLGSDVIREFTDDMVLCSANGMAVAGKVLHSNADQTLAPHNLLAVVDKLSSLTLDSKLSLQSRVHHVGSIVKPIITAYFSGSAAISYRATEAHQSVVDACVSFMQGCHVQEYDIGKEAALVANTDGIAADSLTIKDVLRLILDMALKAIQESLIDSIECVLNDYAGSTIEQYDNRILIAHQQLECGAGTIIVFDGDFTGRKVSLSELVELSEHEKGSVVLEDDYVPVSLMVEAMKAKAIVLRKGSPLSHVAMTAKSIKKPIMFNY